MTAAHTGQEAVAGRPGRQIVLVALMLAMGLAAMDTTIVATAVPQIVNSLGGFSEFSWVFSIYLLTQTVTIPIYGKLADLYGRKMVLIVGIVLFLIGSTLCSAAWNMLALIIFRGLQGIGAGSVQATAQTIAGDLYSLKERGRVQGWLSSVWAMASVAGPALGGVFADYASWRWIFLVNLPFGALAVVLLLRYLQEVSSHRRHAIDYLGSTGVLLSCGVLIFALVEGGGAWPWVSAPSLGCFAAALLLALGTVAVERRAREPVVPGWVWRRRVLAGANLSYLCLGLMVIGPTTFLPIYAQTVLGYGAVAAGFVLAAVGIGWPLAAGLSPRLYLRIGFRDTAILGTVISTLSLAAFLLIPFHAPAWAPVLLSGLLGTGLGLVATPIVVGLQSSVEYHQRGVATGSIMFYRYLGQSIGAAGFAAVVNGTLRSRLRHAPADLRSSLPGSVNQVTTTIVSHRAPAAALDYLRHAMNTSVHYVYLGLALCGLAAVATLTISLPRRFDLVEGGELMGEPAQRTARSAQE